MSKKPLQYDKIVESALRGVVSAALIQVAEHGLPAGHALYITFLTGQDGVDVPEYFDQQFPDEMTIVLQHQFWDLEVTDEAFAVTLSFEKIRQRLNVPFTAVTAFADPAVQFGLKFETGGKVEHQPRPADVQDRSANGAAASDTAIDATARAPGEIDLGQVVNLDSFRKK